MSSTSRRASRKAVAARRARASRGADIGEAGRRRDRDLLFALLLFSTSLAVRLFFWRATPDAAWPYTAAFQGDAPVWLDYASAIGRGEPFELGIPIHPPGTAWLAALASPSVAALRLLWCVLGAAIPVAVFLAAARSFDAAVAYLAGALAAASTAMLLLSASVDAETPYLLLVFVSLYFFEDLRRPRLARLAVFFALNGLACLFRVEHALFAAAMFVFVVALWRRDAAREGRLARGRLRNAAALAAVCFVLPLVPWHLKAWRSIARFNTEERSAEREAVRPVEEALSGMVWTPEAVRGRERLPAFLRRTQSAFVAATVAYRGGVTVRGEDFGIIREAFGDDPRPLARFPFVSSYGPLNFALANHSGATGGFDVSRLEEPPPLAGGAERYPAALVAGLPPGQLSFVYPPHVRLFREGYAIGMDWIARHPLEFARLAARKLAIFWSGAALGLTGWNFPLGLSGVRRAVDLVVPEGGAVAVAWRLALLVLAALGVAAGWRRVATWPWLLFFGSKVAATVLFFGYARQGAAVFPVLALLFALAGERRAFRSTGAASETSARRLAAVLLAAAVAAEGARYFSRPTILVDGRAVDASGDPFPLHGHADRRIDVR